jgi:hypothetical protein
MAKNPQDRYANCTEFAVDLGAALTAWKEAAHRDTPSTLVTSVPVHEPGASAFGWRTLSAGGTRGLVLWGIALAILGALAAAPILVRGQARQAAVGEPLAGPRAAMLAAGPRAGATAPSAAPIQRGTLAVTLVHRFESGVVWIRIDGTEAIRERLTGSGGKTRWSRSFPVVAGRRRLEIRVAGEQSDTIDGIDVEVPAGGETMVNVGFSPMTRRLRIRPVDGGPEEP